MHIAQNSRGTEEHIVMSLFSGPTLVTQFPSISLQNYFMHIKKQR